jgi:hypothetical protein
VRRIMLILLILLISINLFDVITTYILLNTGNFEEANILMTALMEKVGVVNAMILAKGSSLTLWILVYIKLSTKRETLLYVIFGSIALMVYLYLMIKNNFMMLLNI